MSERRVPVGWNRSKGVIDAFALAAISLYLLLFVRLGPLLETGTQPIDDQTRAMRAWGSCAFLALSFVLAIGPLCRLDPRFLPLLYNRRHLGVLTCTVALGHAMAVLGWYFAYSAIDPFEAVLGADVSFGQLHGFPFIPFGLFGLIVLVLLAATSHDFWLAFLGPPLWKALHMTLYLSYASIVLHVTLGALQDARDPLLAMMVTASVVALAALHLAAAARERRRDARVRPRRADGWVAAGELADIADGHGIVVHLADAEPIAIFRDGARLAAVTNLCAHQNGPLGEGRVIDGCITCPWHGFQYRFVDGCAPPPFTEKLSTFRLRLEGTTVLLDPRGAPPGMPVPPLDLGEAAP